MAERGLLVDYGGVLTSDVFVAFNVFCKTEGLPHDAVRDLFRHDPRARDLLARLETGALDTPGFEAQFAPLLGVDPERLVERLFAAMRPDATMLAAVAAAKAQGVPTASSRTHGAPARSTTASASPSCSTRW